MRRAGVLGLRLERRMAPGAVERAGFFLLQPQSAFSQGAGEHVLVVGAASWSNPDLAALDRLTPEIATCMLLCLMWATGHLKTSCERFPGAPNPKATPFVLQYKRGALTYAGDGHEATLWLDQI